MSGRLMAWVGAVLAAVALAVFLALQGLERADQWSSVLSLFFTVTGFALSMVGLVRQRSAAGGQSADGASAGGSVRLLRNIRARDVIIHDSANRGGVHQRPTSAVPSGTGSEAGQSTREVSAGGDIVQADGVRARGTFRIGTEDPQGGTGQGEL